MGVRTTCDILIVGAGLVGASLACSLKEAGYKVVVVDARPPVGGGDAFDDRIYALSPASQSFLDSLGIWWRLDASRVEPVRAMQVHGDDGTSRLEFSAYECGVDRLATIVESGALLRGLWTQIEAARGVELICPATPAELALGKESGEICLDDGRTVSARLIVGADGMQSWVRSAAGLTAQVDPAGHHAVVANFSCSLPHHGVAFQWFRDDGVLAWLPLPGRRISMVWSTQEAHAVELVASEAADLCEKVAQAGRMALGEITLLNHPKSFPLAWLSVARRAKDRLVLLGDAAHVVHPLSGQGVNLGFGDARELAAILGGAARRQADPGELRL